MKTLLTMLVTLILTAEAFGEPCKVYFEGHNRVMLILNGEQQKKTVVNNKEGYARIFMSKANLEVGDVLVFQCARTKHGSGVLFAAVFSAIDDRFLFGSASDGWVSSTRRPKPRWYRERPGLLIRSGNQRIKIKDRCRFKTGMSRFLSYFGRSDFDIDPIWGYNRNYAFLKRAVSKSDLEKK